MRFGHPHIVLFALGANSKFPLLLFPDPMTWKQDACHYPWDILCVYAFPPFALMQQVLLRVMSSAGLSMILVAPLLSQKEWFVDLQDLLVEEIHEFLML